MYSYSQAGPVTTQRMRAAFGALPPVDFDAAYTWDNESRMTGVTYPYNALPGAMGRFYGPKYAYQYDNSALGRLTGDDGVAFVLQPGRRLGLRDAHPDQRHLWPDGRDDEPRRHDADV
jgi:hypothetical protein